MNRGARDTFALVINFFLHHKGASSCHVGLFEANDTIEARLIKQMKALLERFKVTSRIL
jgi:hypothetical protein